MSNLLATVIDKVPAPVLPHVAGPETDTHAMQAELRELREKKSRSMASLGSYDAGLKYQ